METAKVRGVCRVLSMLGISVALGCSADELLTTSELLNQPLDAQIVQLAIDLPRETAIDTVAIDGVGELHVEEKATIRSAAGPGATVTNAASGVSKVESRSRVGSVVSVAPVELGKSATVDGSVKSAGAVVDRGAQVSGTILPNAAIPVDTQLLDVVSIPAGGAAPIRLSPGETRAIAPGSYRGLHAPPGSTVQLTAGRYVFGAAFLMPGAHLEIDDAAGPVIVYVVRRLHLAAVVSGSTDAAPALLIGYLGSRGVEVAGVFEGTLVAPGARVDVLAADDQKDHGNCRSRHRHRHGRHHGRGDHHSNGHGGGHGYQDDDTFHSGAFFAKKVKVHAGVEIVHASFPWDALRIGQTVTPTLACVLVDGARRFAMFGYDNGATNTVEIPVGFSNSIVPAEAVAQQPTRFLPGHHTFVYGVEITAGTVAWRLGGGLAEANASSPTCGAIGGGEEPEPPPDPDKEGPEDPGAPTVAGDTFDETSAQNAPFAELIRIPSTSMLQQSAPTQKSGATTTITSPLLHDRPGDRAVEVVLINVTDRVLLFHDGEGEGAITTQPPAFIRAGSYGTWETRDDALLQGTGGHITFTAGSGLTIKLTWNDPYIGDNDYTSDLSGADAGQFAVDRVGGNGFKTTVFFTLRPRTTAQTNCPRPGMQWIIDNLRAMEEPLSFFPDQTLGVVSTPAKRAFGVGKWRTTGCRATRVVGHVRQVAWSTDRFWTIDVELEEFEGALLTGTNKGIRIEVDPNRGASGLNVNPAWEDLQNDGLGLLGVGGGPDEGKRIIFSGDVLIDHSSFLEVHPTTPIEGAADCDTFAPGTEPLYCSTVLRNIHSISASNSTQVVNMGRSAGRACLLVNVGGNFDDDESDLATAIDPMTGDWILTARSTSVFPVTGRARCIAANHVSQEFTWQSGDSPLTMEAISGTHLCYLTHIGGRWSSSSATVQIDDFSSPARLFGSPSPNVRGGARCIDVFAAGTFPPFLLDDASPARVFLKPVEFGCFLNEINGPILFGSSVDMSGVQTNAGQLFWTGGIVGADFAAIVCDKLSP